MLAFLDRSNIGNAETAGMKQALKLTGNRYNWLLTIFYITYIVFEFCLLFWKLFPPHIVGAVVVFLWGLFATLQAAVHNWSGMMAIRFFLGACEAAYAPGIIYLLSFFYLRHEVGFRIGMFAAAAPLALTFSGALAYGITRGHPSLANWRVLFLVEGLPTIAMVPFAYFFIADSTEHARFLDPHEKQIVKSRAMRQTGQTASERVGGLTAVDFGKTLLDLKAWLSAIMYFGANVSYASLPLFLPTILTEMGYSAIDSQGLSAPPYFVSFLLALITTYAADRTQQRALFLVASATLGGVGYVILATVNTVGVRYFAVYLAAAGVFPTIPNILAWTTNNQGSDTRRGSALVLINVVGQCGPILGTNIFESTDAPRYVRGMSVCAAFMFFTAVIALIQRTLLIWENKNLDNKYGQPVVRTTKNVDLSEIAAEDYGPQFRYAL
ncbi:MAG: hypothetical protein Q9162_000362 [Coniocarpon cinnabarinum]